MSAEDAIRPRDVPFRMVGEGLAQTFRCGQCQMPKAMHGRRMQTVRSGSMRGMRAWVCASCGTEAKPT